MAILAEIISLDNVFQFTFAESLIDNAFKL